ncbi:hypothetical protein NE236_04735 [Actinoallomurus purpureus]|uniref:hypothetical protein n=1 Tax=Actinoallomurus purpureus TaxID=478114 RepID=UPI0020934035|nr:hypothetical protein [Actinoallomurus purpureus]MCO6004279.1 hypothetical protein [Actinoallomurus purpureus]
MNTPNRLDLDALVRERREVEWLLTDPEPTYDAEFKAELQGRVVKLVEHMAGPLSEIVDKVGALMNAVQSHGDTKLAQLDEQDLLALFWLFSDLWKKTTGWGDDREKGTSRPWGQQPQGDELDHTLDALGNMTNLVDQNSKP